jgi:DmsE family decaheme c-type cytochrome
MNQIAMLRRLLAGLGLGAMLALSAPTQAAESLVLRDDAKCTRCHNEEDSPKVLQIGQTRHGVKADSRSPSSCTSCHGASEQHQAKVDQGQPRVKPDVVFGAKSATPPEKRNEACLACHADARRSQWSNSAHARDEVSCTDCHAVHNGHDAVREKLTQGEVCFACHKEQRAQAQKPSHHPIREGKVVCAECHNPHGSTGPKMLVKNTVNQTCYTCHAEKRGPFLWEHSPAQDDCSNCHTPHGSTVNNLLKARPPFLCQECHQDHGSSLKNGNSVASSSGTPAAGVNTTAALNGKYLTVQGNGRMCLNCHVMVHGSNHPAGSKFNR